MAGLADQFQKTNRKARRRAQALARRSVRRTEASRAQSSSSAQSQNLIPEWRAALLGTAVAGALIVSQPNGVHAQAVVNAPGTGVCANAAGPIATCTGDLVGGVTVTGPGVTTLNVNASQGISPLRSTLMESISPRRPATTLQSIPIRLTALADHFRSSPREPATEFMAASWDMAPAISRSHRPETSTLEALAFRGISTGTARSRLRQ